jgi:hypothetical protein
MATKDYVILRSASWIRIDGGLRGVVGLVGIVNSGCACGNWAFLLEKGGQIKNLGALLPYHDPERKT